MTHTLLACFSTFTHFSYLATLRRSFATVSEVGTDARVETGAALWTSRR